MGSTGSQARYIDNVKIYASSQSEDPDPENGEYAFVKIADTQTTFQLLDQEPTLNDSGTVAFWAEESDGVDGIFTGGGTLTTVLHRNEPNMQDIWGYKSINNNGVVAVQLQYLQNNTTIETRKGNTKTTIVSVANTDFTHLGDPQINDDGLVSFWGQNWVTTVGIFQGVYTGDGNSPITTILDHTAGDNFYRFAEATSINNTGEVAFAAKSDGGEYQLYKKSGGTALTSIAETGEEFMQLGGADGKSAINNTGNVVFNGNGLDGIWMWSRVFSSNGNSITEHILANMDGSTPFFTVLYSPAMNDSGNIVFWGQHTGAGLGLYTGNDPVINKVVEYGDMLDGKEVYAI
jgi:hypothetical protein